MGATWYAHHGRRMTDSEKQKVYALKNPEKIKERNARRDNKQAYRDAKTRYLKDPRAYLLKCAKRRAVKYEREFSITVDDIVIPTHCPILGLELTVFSDKIAAPNSMSLDRINNDLGYVSGNVVVISYRANVLKKDATVEELEAIVNFYKKENNEQHCRTRRAAQSGPRTNL